MKIFFREIETREIRYSFHAQLYSSFYRNFRQVCLLILITGSDISKIWKRR